MCSLWTCQNSKLGHVASRTIRPSQTAMYHLQLGSSPVHTPSVLFFSTGSGGACAMTCEVMGIQPCKWRILTYLIENDGDPWQPTCWLQMAHNEMKHTCFWQRCWQNWSWPTREVSDLVLESSGPIIQVVFRWCSTTAAIHKEINLTISQCAPKVEENTITIDTGKLLILQNGRWHNYWSLITGNCIGWENVAEQVKPKLYGSPTPLLRDQL